MHRFTKNRIYWGILILFSVWLLISFSLTDEFHNLGRFVMQVTPTLIGFAIIILVNVKYLLPKFYLQKKYLFYFLAATLLLTATVVLLFHGIFPWAEWFRLPPPPHLESMTEKRMPPPGGIKWIRELTPFIIVFLGSTLLELIRYSNIKDKEKLAAELKFLKSQVNPHFLFNALNNIYSLAVVQAPQTPESVMQLSEILRYMVYDSNEEKVPLKSEINYIENFVDLHLLKDSRGMNVQLDLDKSAPNLMVAPLLFIPFVENAFKHSKIENLKDGFIKIKLKTDNRNIAFQVVNSVPKNNFTKDEVGGVGLENIKKRLKLLYPEDQYDLKINLTDDQFDIILKISIQ